MTGMSTKAVQQERRGIQDIKRQSNLLGCHSADSKGSHIAEVRELKDKGNIQGKGRQAQLCELFPVICLRVTYTALGLKPRLSSSSMECETQISQLASHSSSILLYIFKKDFFCVCGFMHAILCVAEDSFQELASSFCYGGRRDETRSQGWQQVPLPAKLFC